MQVSFGDVDRELRPGSTLSFGRDSTSDIVVTNPDDAVVSSRAGELRWDGLWRVTNVGRRAFFVVDAGSEVELLPDAHDRSTYGLQHDDAWIRVPVTGGDVAIVLEIPEAERPTFQQSPIPATGTLVESDVSLTDNELRSVVAVYDGFLQLPPLYRREPNSYRAAARRLGVEEGKVKADLRRVQTKVAQAGGPADGGSRVRDALIRFLASRGIVTRRHLSLID